MPQKLVPITSYNSDGWPVTGASAHEAIDEAPTPDDSDYITAPTGFAEKTIRFEMESGYEPNYKTANSHIIHIRGHSIDGEPAPAVVRLYNDFTLFKEFSMTFSTSLYTWQLVLSAYECTLLTEWDNFQITIIRPWNESPRFQVMQLYFEIPFGPFAHLDMQDSGLKSVAALSGYHLLTDAGGLNRQAGNEAETSVYLDDAKGAGGIVSKV